MRCETCQGKGLVRRDDMLGPAPAGGYVYRATYQVCPDCTGGVAHCCDGLREQEKPAEVESSADP